MIDSLDEKPAIDSSTDRVAGVEKGQNEQAIIETSREGSSVLFANGLEGNEGIADVFQINESGTLKELENCLKRGYDRINSDITAQTSAFHPLKRMELKVKLDRAYKARKKELEGQK